MRIQHNIAGLNSYRNLGVNQRNLSKNLEKLSSGFRINRAGDDHKQDNNVLTVLQFFDYNRIKLV